MHIAEKHFNSILEAVKASERWHSFHCCTATSRNWRETHHVHPLKPDLKKYPLETKCWYGFHAGWGSERDWINHTYFKSFAFTRAQFTNGNAWEKMKRWPCCASHTLASFSAPWCFSCWAHPLLRAPRGGSSTPGFGKPLQCGTGMLCCPWNRTDILGKCLYTLTHSEILSTSKLNHQLQ